MSSSELQWMGLTPTASSQVGLYITGIQQLTATQTTVLYRRALMCYLSCILRLPVCIACIVRAFLYLPALQMFSNARTVFILTLRLCIERPFSNNVVFLSNRHNG